MTTLADRLRNERAAQELTQQQAADILGTTRQFVGQIERGEKIPGEPTIANLATLLGCDLDEAYALCGRIPPDIRERLAGNLGAIKRVRMLEFGNGVNQ